MPLPDGVSGVVDGRWTLQTLASALRSSVGHRTRHAGRPRLRAASSAGGRYPIDAYVRSVDLPGLPDGVWYVDLVADELVQVGTDPGPGPAAVVLTALPWRTCWRYAERGYRMLWWDAGTVLAGWEVTTAARGLPTSLLGHLPDQDLGACVGCLSPDELPVLAWSLGGPGAWDAVPGPVESGSTGQVERLALVVEAHASGAEPARGDDEPPGVGSASTVDVGRERRLAAAVAGRRSTRRFDRSAAPARDSVLTLIDDTARRLAGDAVTLRVVVHDVPGLEPGSYEWDGALSRVGPRLSRDDTRRLCLAQDPGADSAFLLLWTTELGDSTPMRSYRWRQPSAGRELGPSYLAAAQLGLGCTGLSFVDELVRDWFDADGLVVGAYGVPSSGC